LKEQFKVSHEVFLCLLKLWCKYFWRLETRLDFKIFKIHYNFTVKSLFVSKNVILKKMSQDGQKTGKSVTYYLNILVMAKKIYQSQNKKTHKNSFWLKIITASKITRVCWCVWVWANAQTVLLICQIIWEAFKKLFLPRCCCLYVGCPTVNYYHRYLILIELVK